MNAKTLMRAVLIESMRSMFSWRCIVRETLHFGMAWGTYFILLYLLKDPEMNSKVPSWIWDHPRWLPEHTYLFAMTAFTAGLAYAIASFKSALPAAIALLLALVWIAFGMPQESRWALVAASSGAALYTIGFSFHGGRVRQFSFRSESC